MLFVQAEDVKYYVDPLIQGDDWHIHFDDNEPHIVIKKFPNTTFISGRKRAQNVLGKLGRVEPREPRHTGPKGLEFDFELLKPIPIPSGSIACVTRPRADSVFLGWEMDFETEDVLAVFTKNKDYDPLLGVFLLNCVFWQSKEMREDLRKQILRQLSWVELFRDLEVAEIPNLERRLGFLTRLKKCGTSR